MIKRSTKIAFEVLLALIALTTVLLGVSIWRLSEKPLSVDFLSPYLEASLASDGGGFGIDIGETVLIWADWGRNVDLRARSVRLRDADGFTVASLPELSISLSLRALAQGVVAPTAIEAFGARVTLVRDETGRFDFGQDGSFGEEEEGEQDESETPDLSMLIPDILGELLSEPTPDRPLSFLRQVRLDQGELIVYDRKLRRFWTAPSATIDLQRGASGLIGDLSILVDTEFGRASFELGVEYPAADGMIGFTARVEDLELALLSTLDQRLSDFAGAKLVVGGAARATATPDGLLRTLTFDLRGGAGSVSVPGNLQETLAVESLRLGGGFDWPSERFTLDQAEVRFAAQPDDREGAGPVLTASGTLDLAGPGLAVGLTARAEDLQASELPLYWPPPIAKAARKWVVENIAAGQVDEAGMEVALRSADGRVEALELDRLSGFYRFRDVEVHYLRPLPPAEGVDGLATFDAAHMAFELDSGELSDIELTDGEVVIDYASEPDSIDITLTLGGPVATALHLLDHERLQLIGALGIDPADARGLAGARVEFDFPLIKTLTFEDVKVSVVANLTNVFLREVLLGRDASAGEFALSVDNDGMTLVGPVRIDDVPAALNWRENFDDEVEPKSLFGLSVQGADQGDLSRFGLDLAPYLDGPVVASVDMRVAQNDSAKIEASLDVTGATLSLPFLFWSKPEGTAGSIEFSAGLADGRLIGLDGIEVRAGSLAASGRAWLDESGSEIKQAYFGDLAFGGSRLSEVEITRDGEGAAITVGGGFFDAAPFLGSDRIAEDGGGSGDPPIGIRIEAPELETVSFGRNRYLETASLLLDRRPDGWERISFSALVPRALWTEMPEVEEAAPNQNFAKGGAEGGREGQSGAGPDPAPAAPEEPAVQPDRRFSFQYLPAPAGGYVLDARAYDVGGLLRALDLRDTVIGGTLRISGESAGRIPRQTMTARIRMKDFVLVRAPTLAKILSAASFTGLFDALSGRGIRFEELRTDIAAKDGIVETDLLRVYGPGLGVTAKGSVDLNEATLDLEGTVVPAYSVNSILSGIPVLGPLLTGGEGQGIFAFVYSMTGSLDDPEVSVNPLSGLAPGFLRGLFGGIDGDEATVYPEGRK